jgi:hypothetical protein
VPAYKQRQQQQQDAKKTVATQLKDPPMQERTDGMKMMVKELISDYLSKEMSQTLISLLAALSSRCQVNNPESKQKTNTKVINFDLFNFTSEEEFKKLWLAFAPTCDSSVTDDKFLIYLETVLSQYLRLPLPSAAGTSASLSAASGASPRTTTAAASNTASPPDNLFVHVQRRVFCHLIRDEILHSCWNKISQSKNGTRDPKTRTISYSAFKAFVRRSHIDVIEQKLQYLVLLQNSSGRGSVNYLVHFFIPTIQDGPFRDETQLNHLIMLAFDPISSTIFTMKASLSLSHLLLSSSLFCLSPLLLFTLSDSVSPLVVVNSLSPCR